MNGYACFLKGVPSFTYALSFSGTGGVAGSGRIEVWLPGRVWMVGATLALGMTLGFGAAAGGGSSVTDHRTHPYLSTIIQSLICTP